MSLRLLVLGLVLLVHIVYTVQGHDAELDPEGDNVCRRRVRESRLILRNVTVPCYRAEISQPPCKNGSHPIYDWRWRRDRRRYHGPSTSLRKRRDLSTTTMPPMVPRSTSYPWWLWTTTAPSTTTTTAPAEGMCLRRVRTTCWRLYVECVIKYVTYHYCCNGYEPDGQGGCRMEIECSDGNGGCEHMCYHDDELGHHCGCFTGYNLVDDTVCEDIDECAVNNGGCSQTCTNTPGSFFCSCDSGYILTNQTHCTEVNECAVENGGCDQICTNKQGSHFCSCEEGFDLVDGTECRDVDECLLSNGGCSHKCENLYGGYSCNCPEGIELDETGFHCIIPEVNQCEIENGGCDQICTANEGSHFCSCREGFILVDGTECREESNNPEPLSAIASTFRKPLVYGPIIGGILLLILLLCLVCCLCARRRRRAPQPPVAGGAEAGVVFVVGKKKDKKEDLGPGAEFGEKPPLELEVDPDDDLYDMKCKSENLYSAPPSVISYGSEPPPYTETDGNDYEDVDSIQEVKVTGFDNMAYMDNERNHDKEGEGGL